MFRKLTVEENILLVWEALGVPETGAARACSARCCASSTSTHIRDQKAYALSGGERRRCEVARALAGNPDFIMLDEPFTGIDPVTIER